MSGKPSVEIVSQCSFSLGLVARRISQQHRDHVANRQCQANATQRDDCHNGFFLRVRADKHANWV